MAHHDTAHEQGTEAMLNDLSEDASAPSRTTLLLMGAVVIGVAVAVFVTARGYGLGELQHPGPGSFPALIAAGMGIMGVLLLAQAAVENPRRRPANTPLIAAGTRRVLFMGAVLTVYVVGLYTVGFTISSVLATLAMTHVLDAKLSWLGRATYSVVLVLIVELVMTAVFSVRFPGGLVGIFL
ncbi:tripartite tricarboxylate transporter TctB family protein [Ornithinimicrobium cavernae]|uniref:tripartite tricarboxylate transporter TctB family protein n=1 Tax=Ornithinimicrobium cavernae TaxID=2666047 RepID=UPI000D688DAC|nr:tripartite tricarboxylate transporter TctB family protein [Ornithinimicrobium cavernae]